VSHILNIPFSGGYVSTGTGARDASDLDTGELQEMAGGYYKKNDPNQVWNIPGRLLFGSAGSGAVKGLAICQFDEGGTDKLVAAIGTTLVAATPGATGTFASLVTGLASTAQSLTACQQDDRWYLGNGVDSNRCLKPDGTVRLMGMQTPTQQPTCTPTASTHGVFRPTTDTGNWDNPTRAYDTNETTEASTYAYTGFIGVHTWAGFSTDATAGRFLKILWSAVRYSYTIQFWLDKSEDFGVTWTTFNYGTINQNKHGLNVGPDSFPKQWAEVPITAGINNSAVKFRATFQAEPGNGSMYIADVKIEYGSAALAVSTTFGGIRYAYTEYNDADDLESAPSERSALVTLSSNTAVVVARPNGAANTSSTHWRVYRIGDGIANTIDNLGKVSGNIDISTTTWTDVLDIAVTEQALPLVAAVNVGDLSFPRDEPPPTFMSMISWKGSICGISKESRRSWYYSEGGRGESFPKIYVVSSFPLDEHDVLMGQMAVGETLVLLCRGAALAIEDVPRATDGVFDAGNARPIKGHPGCCSEYGYTTYSVSGEPRGAWVSPFGVYITNGQTCACISTDLCWEREVNVPYLGTSVLRWDAKNVILWFEFDLDGDGLNDHEMPFHMAEAHSKGEARPKLGQPTAKATSCMASALIDSTHYRFSGHPSDGSVYVEESGSADASTGETVALSIRSAQVSHDKVDLGIVKATLNHSNFGTGETGTLVATLYRDSANTENSRSQSIRLDGNRGTTVGVGRAGELVDVTFEYSGSGSGGVGGVDLEVDGHGRSGSAPRVTSNSATP
jgi:hypothetical protein